jgi:hypothetical protein
MAEFLQEKRSGHLKHYEELGSKRFFYGGGRTNRELL